jgi:hypothetical protein
MPTGVQSGSEEAIVAAFEQHPELADMCPADGRTMLHQGAGKGALRWMQWLLDRGADAMVGAETMKGNQGHTVFALPHDRLRQLFRPALP